MNQHTPNERQHYINLLEEFDWKPKVAGIGLAFKVPDWYGMKTINLHVEVKITRPMEKMWECYVFTKLINPEKYTDDVAFDIENICYPPRFIVESHSANEYGNIFTYLVQYLIYNYRNFDDIKFMKDLWRELLKIKNESL